MKPLIYLSMLLLCVGCGKPSAIVGRWQSVNAHAASGAKNIEFYSDGRCRLDLSGQYYDWKLSGRRLTLIRPKTPEPVLAAVDFPDEEHMDYAPLDTDTGREMPTQKMVRVGY